ncbi:flagellar basal body rod protein FlgG [Domibacillus antri]|uniref:Flagellar hook protein FlgE n=1 Tax=Domibacillus antri TaxID=1714264 RepID=A0A1Q8Q621_9BACI|nr:flagellar basal-body rod protein FlgG [Domibacillus antri]OLN22783.1 flagellar basal body rod protein FlgG [Domibacillus antri]
MLRSMYSGISGMKNFQTKLDVIGNNISNVNTYGFKKGRTIFKDMVSQQLAGATAPTAIKGGTNPRQVGLGAQLAAIDTNHTTGSLQTTGRTLDLAISGDGFFQVAESANAGRTGFTNEVFTRAGNFYLDSDGYLVNGDGLFVVGYGARERGTPAVYPTPNQIGAPNPAPTAAQLPLTTETIAGFLPEDTGNGNADIPYQPIQIPTDAQSMSIGADGTVTFVDAAGVLRWAGQLVIAKFSNPEGMEKVGGNYFQQTTASGGEALAAPGLSGNGEIVAGTLEMSNVDLSEEFTEMIVAQRGFQANTRIITTSDEILQELMSMKR